MIREQRNRDKLVAYYEKFVKTGEIDPNVHPWVADSWSKSRALKVPMEQMCVEHRLTSEAFVQRQKKHQMAIEYLESMADDIREFLQKYDLCLLLLDADCVVLKNYALPYFQMTTGEIEGVCMGLKEIARPASASPGNMRHRSGFSAPRCGWRTVTAAMLVRRRFTQAES